MDNPIVDFYYNNELISPSPQMSYKMNLGYNNDIVSGYEYDISLRGVCVSPQGLSAHITRSMTEKQILQRIFSQNNGILKITANTNPIFYATGVTVQKISFPSNDNYWSKYINYNIDLKANHLFVGENLLGLAAAIEKGEEDLFLTNNLHSPNMVDISRFKIKSFNENFNIDTSSNHFDRTTIYDDESNLTNSLGGEYCSISYSINAIGKHDIQYAANNPLTLPAWVHAKRFVHQRLLSKMGGIFGVFLNLDPQAIREFLHSPNGPGLFVDFQNKNYKIYNEHFSFDISESEGSFSATYNAIIKRPCAAFQPPNLYPPLGPEESYDTGCHDDVIHTVSKSVNKTYNASEDREVVNIDLDNDNQTEGIVVNQDIEITVNGSIEGLVPGGILFSGSRIIINSLNKPGSTAFLTYNEDVDQLGQGFAGGYDKYNSASTAFNKIFDYEKYDLTRVFKNTLGIDAEALSVSPSATLKPSKMAVTRDFLKGTINYTAVYDNKYNCDPNNFEIQLNVDYPNPVIAEFSVPNNNLKNSKGNVCPESRGYDYIQLLGTQTAKKIDVSINASVAQDYNKCCFGTTDNWNLLDYDFFTLQNFIIPSGMNIPYIGDDYVLVEKTKSVTYPRGNMSINLSYICADVCDIENYFTNKDINISRDPQTYYTYDNYYMMESK